ncbi:hypothetical protein D3C75_792140 [compost metagenome]
MPYLSCITLSTGVMALVVQEAAETILSSGPITSWLTPNTTFFISPLPGAVSSTRAAPRALRCSDRPASSRQTPVLSTISALSMP